RLCVPRSPKCDACPLYSLCPAGQEGVAEQYPVKGRRKKPRPVDVAAGFVSWNGRWLIRRRPGHGLLAGLWEFPAVERHPGESWEQAVARALAEVGVEGDVEEEIARIEHVFSHVKWDLRVYRCIPRVPPMDRSCRTTGAVWASPAECTAYAFPTAYRKIWPLLERKETGHVESIHRIPHT
ncbi:MAG: NUDIX domain-containing protein, partial [Alicyclobacillaceae bacterium]|nr:NUDIX domain-containing protein [Alicyclobacillaceae bacterium]